MQTRPSADASVRCAAPVVGAGSPGANPQPRSPAGPSRGPRSLFGILAVGLLATALAACSAGTPAPSVPSVPDASGSPGAAPASSPGPVASQDPEDALLAYARCMRENGVDFPDPQPISGGGAVQEITVDPMSPEFEKAQKTCESKLPAFGGVTDPAANQEFQDQMLAYARCMREHGIDFPDPTFEGGGAVSAVGIEGNVDPNGPAFQEAQKACGSNLPEGGTMVSVGGGAPVTTP